VQQNQQPLGLKIPQQTLDATALPYGRPRDAERWINKLPTAAVGETAKQVYQALAEINRCDLDITSRFKILEHFRGPVQYINKALKRHFFGQPFPLSGKSAKIAELARELQAEMADGYKIIIETSVSGFFPRVDNRILLTSIHRAIRYLGLELLNSYEIYTRAPKNVWSEIHHLYLFAEHNGLDGKPVKDPLNKKSRTATILDLYKHTLLLALCNPYRLPQKEIDKVYRKLEGWAQHSSLHFVDDIHNPPGLFSVNLEKDEAPSYYIANKINGTTYVRVLNTHELTRVIREEVVDTTDVYSEFSAFESSDDLHQDTLRRLILAWGAVPKRGFSRIGKKHDVKLTFGLNATHYYIAKGKVDQPLHNMQFEENKIEKLAADKSDDGEKIVFQERAHFSSTPVQQFGETSRQPDVWELASNPSLQVDSVFSFTSMANATPERFNPNGEKTKVAKTPDPYDAYDALMTNESAGGCRLVWNNDKATKTVVGTIVGIQRTNEQLESQWTIGVIRWLKILDNQKMELGVEIFAPDALDVAIRKVNSNNGGTSPKYVRSLILPQLQNIKQPKTLLLPPTFILGDELELRHENERIRIKLNRLLEATNTFCQFEFAVIAKKPDSAAEPVLEQIKNFDSIWGSI
jgi:hypothetical protein